MQLDLQNRLPRLLPLPFRRGEGRGEGSVSASVLDLWSGSRRPLRFFQCTFGTMNLPAFARPRSFIVVLDLAGFFEDEGRPRGQGRRRRFTERRPLQDLPVTAP